MFKIIRATALALFAALAFQAQAVAGPSEDSQALVDKAIAHYKAVGKDKAFADFGNKDDKGWVNGEFYVIVADAQSGNFLVHAINPKLINNPKLWDLQDVNKIYIIRDMVESGKKAPNGGWTEYTWTHPETKKLAKKRTYVKVEDGLLFMAGYYEG